MKSRKIGLELGIIAIFWLMMLTIVPVRSSPLGWPKEYWIKQYFFVILLIAVYYITEYYLLPRLFGNNRFITFGLSIIGLIVGAMALIYLFESIINLDQKMFEFFRPNVKYNPARRRWFDFSTFIMILLNISIATIVYLVKKYLQETALRRELETLQVNTELSYLKAQINPHFFFNTLHNIYVLIDRNVEGARTAVLKLSSMMRYVLYDNTERSNTVADEIDFIENYIELMKLRLPNRITIKFHKPDYSVDLTIAPLILLPFVENAFKHGIPSHNESEIYISIEVRDRRLHFSVVNPVPPKKGADYQGPGIGIANTKRRLELLYPEAHHFELKQDNNRFEILLTINLI